MVANVKGSRREGRKANGRSSTRACAQPLEARLLLSFAATFPAGATFSHRSDVNASGSLLSPGHEAETAIVVNPVDPQNVHAVTIDFSDAGQTIVQNKAARSSNGGLGYSDSLVPYTPAPASKWYDPAAAFDRQGNLYQVHVTSTDIPFTAHILVTKWAAGAQGWSAPITVVSSSTVDKPWIVTAPHPQFPTDPTRDVVLVVYKDGEVGIRCVRSLDGGSTFQDDTVIPGSAGGHYPHIAVKDDGGVVVVWQNFTADQIRINSSANGISWGLAQTVGSDAVDFWFPFAPTPGKSLQSVPSVAVADRGSLPDRVFVSYVPAPSSTDRHNSEVVVKYSDDLVNWTTCFTTSGNNKAQFHSWIDVDPLTDIPYLVWFDCREDTTNTPAIYAKRYVTASTDNGITWLSPVPISDDSSYSTVNFGYGDYNASDAFGGMAFDVWPHMPGGSSTADLYTDRAILTGHKITVTGNSSADTYHLKLDGEFVKIWENAALTGTPSFIMHKDAIVAVEFNLGGGNDVMNVYDDFPFTLTINGGAGTDEVIVEGGSAANEVLMDLGMDMENLFVNADDQGDARVLLTDSQSFFQLTIGTGGEVRMAPHGNRFLRADAVTIDSGAFLELADNDMIVDAMSYAMVDALLTSGYNGGAWNGSGIRSSNAAATTNRALGSALASDLFTSFPATFVGQSVGSTAVLIRYTYYGDANLDSAVNLQDFNRLAANFGQSSRDWVHGDFNYNGIVNLADFNLLAGNFGESDGPDPGEYYTYEELEKMLEEY